MSLVVSTGRAVTKLAMSELVGRRPLNGRFRKWAPHAALFCCFRLAPMGRTHSSHMGVTALSTGSLFPVALFPDRDSINFVI